MTDNLICFSHFRRSFEKEQSATGSHSNELGPVSFENRLYDDLHAADKVNLPDGKVTLEQSHYATPSAGVSTSLGEYASPLPPPQTLNDYADIAASKDFHLPSSGIGAGAAGVYEMPPDVKKMPPQEWVQFNNDDEKKVPITDFVAAPQYSDPYDLSYPPSYRSSPPSSIQGVSLADLKHAEEDNDMVLPDVYGDLEGDITATTPRLSSSMNSNASGGDTQQNNNEAQMSPSKQITVISQQNIDTSEA